MSENEAYARSFTEDRPVRCQKSQAKRHYPDCLCKGTGWVKACATCGGSGFNPLMQQRCCDCGGQGALSVPTPPKEKE